MGPFGVLARCIVVAHGAFHLLAPVVPLWLFSLVSCGIIFLLTIYKNKIVSILGSILTPLLLASLAAIAIFGLYQTSLPVETPGHTLSTLKLGFLQGYQTMDLLAAFFFSVFVLQHLKAQKVVTNNPAAALPIFFKSALIGAGLLSTVYFILIVLGAMYAPLLVNVPPTEILGTIAQHTLGPWAAPIVCGAVLLACLTTGVVLSSLFADFLKTKVCKDKLKPSWSAAITLGIAFCISTLEFSGIMKFICPIVEFIYPALIVLTVVSIFHKLWGLKILRMPVAITVLLKLLSAI